MRSMAKTRGGSGQSRVTIDGSYKERGECSLQRLRARLEERRLSSQRFPLLCSCLSDKLTSGFADPSPHRPVNRLRSQLISRKLRGYPERRPESGPPARPDRRSAVQVPTVSR
jgi:hypothetical protein